MNVSPENDPFFPPDWQEQARAFLAPFEEEGLPFNSQYRTHIVQEQREEKLDDASRWQATFRLGDTHLELETVRYGMEEETTVIYAGRASFKSPLQFWAYAMLIYWPLHDHDGPSRHAHFDFSREQRSHLLSEREWKQVIEHQWPSGLRRLSDSFIKARPSPSTTEEPMIRAWQNSDRWNEQFCWAETRDSFVMWCWRTFS